MGNKGKIMGIPLPWFVAVFVLVIAAIFLGRVPDKLMGGFAICLTLGIGLQWIGDQIPVLKNYGAGVIFAVLLPAIALYLGILPESVGVICKNFFSGYDYTSFLVPSLLVGSVLAMDRKVLINAGARFIIPMVGSLVLITLVIGLLGSVLGYGFVESMLYIAGPILGSGVSASAVPLSEVYAQYGGGTPDQYLTTLTSSVMIANILTILAAAILSSWGAKHPNFLVKGFSGTKEGDILRIDAELNIDDKQKEEIVKSEDKDATTYTYLRIGFVITIGFYMFGQIGSKFFPAFNNYVFMIVLAIILKVGNLCPEEICHATGEWTKFMSKILTPAALVAIALGSLNLAQLVTLFTDPVYVALCVLTVLITLIISGTLTWLFGFYFVEGSIMAGLGLADMGGTGDVAVLSAAKRMELLPFLTICSRIGGSINMVWLTFVASRFLHG